MKKLIFISFIVFLTSCKYDYIVTNPKHPEEYVGVWNNDSIYVNGKNVNHTISPIFGIYQEEVVIGSITYQSWEVDNTKNPYQFIGMNVPDVPLITYDVIKPPNHGKMELKQNTTVYYFTKYR